VRVFVEPNKRFRLPEDPFAPIIMIAAGTGIAPYRAFMQEMEVAGHARDSWLIFGNPHLRTDFLYQREWLKWRESGFLNRIDTAWSRDGSEKRYVQHVVSEQSDRLGRWLERGAHIYICGGLDMGQAVNQAIQQNLATESGTSFEEAAVPLALLQRTKRIHKDLY
jgi:sulfite reductase (NADPH) flavoprotein alpha-component